MGGTFPLLIPKIISTMDNMNLSDLESDFSPAKPFL